MEGRFVVNAEAFRAFWAVFCAAFTGGLRRVVFFCKRGRWRGDGRLDVRSSEGACMEEMATEMVERVD